jgi:coenzyme PQQ precursor peptide PqqA
MTWTKPDFEEISLCMEVTAYVNTSEELPLPGGGDQPPAAGKALNNNVVKG